MMSVEQEPIVSVVVIFFNAERFLAEALASVKSQTLDAWELLLVDDGSTDGSAAIASSAIGSTGIAARLIAHPGGSRMGMSASRNLGARHAKGCFLAFLDADDVWYPEKLAEQVSLLSAEPRADAIFGRTLYWSSWPGSGLGKENDSTPPLGIAPGSLVEPPSLLHRLYPLGKLSAPSISNLMVRRQAYEMVGGFEPQFRGYYEDQAFLAKLYFNCRILIANTIWDRYRQHQGSCSAAVAREGSHHEHRKVYLKWLSGYLRQQPRRNKELEALVDMALIQCKVRGTGNKAIRRALEWTGALARTYLPDKLRRGTGHCLRALTRRPPVGLVRFGSLHRLTPISADWGEDRGIPIDRFYIERFLVQCADDIHGRVLEVQENDYTRRFGAERVTISDVLSVSGGNPKATVIADLANAPNIADSTYNCIILTQTIQLIYDFGAVIRTLHRILRPGGVVLATVPGISKIARDEVDNWTAQWHFSEPSARRAFSTVFGDDNVETNAHGNVLAAISFLHGLGVSELKVRELEYNDRDFPLIITTRARKAS